MTDHRLLADTYTQTTSAMTTRERLAEGIVGAGYLVAVAALLVIAPPGEIRVGPAVLSLLLMILATRVRFDTPLGFTVATQLAFVPMLFAVPVTVVPLITVAAFALADVPDLLRGRIHPSRVLLAIGNSWFTIGPVAVFAISGIAPKDAGLGLLLAALGAQFTVDFLVSGVRLAIARDADLRSLVGDCWIYAVDAALSGVALAVAQDMQKRPAIELVIAPMLALLAVFAHERRARLKSMLELGNAYRGTALVLGDVVEADDAYTGEHCKGVVALVLEVGARLGLGPERMRNLEFGALLHDVGKVAIPKEIINKPGKLDPAEWTVIKTHTIEGQRMLDRVGGFMRDVGLIVRSHHERWDGGGYPDGLAGTAIPLEARIIACCDSWDAMRTDRSYRQALPVEVARAELEQNSGSQFDPSVVATLIEVLESPAVEAEVPAALRPAASQLGGRELGAVAQ